MEDAQGAPVAIQTSPVEPLEGSSNDAADSPFPLAIHTAAGDINLDPETFLADAVNSKCFSYGVQVNDMISKGFDSFEEYAAEKLNLPTEESRRVLQDGIDKMYHRLLDDVDDRLSKWEALCREHFASIQKNASVVSSSVKVVVSGDSTVADSFKELDDQEKSLDRELLSLRAQLLEEERNARKIGREIAASEKKLAAYSSLNLPKFEVTVEEAIKSAAELKKKRDQNKCLREQQMALATNLFDRDTSHRVKSRGLNDPLLLEVTAFQEEAWTDQRFLER